VKGSTSDGARVKPVEIGEIKVWGQGCHNPSDGFLGEAKREVLGNENVAYRVAGNQGRVLKGRIISNELGGLRSALEYPLSEMSEQRAWGGGGGGGGLGQD